MERVSSNAAIVARMLVSNVFLLNALGIIDQSIPAKEMGERGAPEALVPLFMFLGRSVELVAGLALAFGVLPRLAALALLAFLIPATRRHLIRREKTKVISKSLARRLEDLEARLYATGNARSFVVAVSQRR